MEFFYFHINGENYFSCLCKTYGTKTKKQNYLMDFLPSVITIR